MRNTVSTVYIVDDDNAVRDSLMEVLRLFGFGTQAFASGQEVLESADSFGSGCLLMDIRLPDMDGFSVLELLRSRGVSIPVVLMTGHDDLAGKARSPRVGAYAVLEKPLSDKVLRKTLERALGRSPCATAA